MKGQKPAREHTMLLAFRAANVRSFRDPLDFSMEATTLAQDGVAREIPWRDGSGPRSTVSLLPVAGVFGANASGKTNLLRVMADMRLLVRQSFKQSGNSDHTFRYPRHAYRLDPTYASNPSSFEVDLVIDGVRWEYGFRIDDSHVIEEWARRYPHGKAQTIFDRYEMDLGIKTSRASAVKELARPDALLLSVAEAAKYPELKPLYDWFANNFVLATAASRPDRWRITALLLSDDARRALVLSLLRIADLGITDAKPRNPNPEELEKLRKIVKALKDSMREDDDSDDDPLEGVDADIDTVLGIFLSHRGVGGTVEFEGSDESLGTLVWLGLIGSVISALSSGSVLLVDEIESSLHPTLVIELVTLFQNPVSNPNNSQLIFNSHEARLLGESADDRVIGRDQVWFTEKSNDGSTRLYPLSDMSPRKTEAIGPRYLSGRYGAKPLISRAELTALARAVALADSSDES
ncbi:ATP-binding protein [Mycolicibacterium elephantis]